MLTSIPFYTEAGAYAIGFGGSIGGKPPIERAHRSFAAFCRLGNRAIGRFDDTSGNLRESRRLVALEISGHNSGAIQVAERLG